MPGAFSFKLRQERELLDKIQFTAKAAAAQQTGGRR